MSVDLSDGVWYGEEQSEEVMETTTRVIEAHSSFRKQSGAVRVGSAGSSAARAAVPAFDPQAFSVASNPPVMMIDNNERKLADEGRGTARGTKKKVKGFRHVHYYGSTFTGNASPRSNFNLTAHFDENRQHKGTREARAVEYLQNVKSRHLMSPRVAGSRPPSCARSSCVDSTKPKWGMRLHDHPSGRVTLSGVKRESPAQKAGLRKGDIIMELSDRGVFTAQQAADLLAVPKQAVTVRYKRNLREYLTTMWA